MTSAVTQRVLLVEGASDAAAVHGVAALLGRSLSDEGVAVVAMGGATNVARHLADLPPTAVPPPLLGALGPPPAL